MDGRKLHHFVCFAVTMGLVAFASRDTTAAKTGPGPAPAADPGTTSAATSNGTKPQSESKSTVKPPALVNSTVNSTPTKLDPTSSFKSSRPAPSNAVTPPVRKTAMSENKTCPTVLAEGTHDVGTHQTALCQIMSRALLFTCIVLLITVTALACKVNHLKGRLINGAGRWGVAETSVMLEEVTPVQNEEETAAAWSVARVQYGC